MSFDQVFSQLSLNSCLSDINKTTFPTFQTNSNADMALTMATYSKFTVSPSSCPTTYIGGNDENTATLATVDGALNIGDATTTNVNVNVKNALSVNGLNISGVSGGTYTICPTALSNMEIGSTTPGLLNSLNINSGGNLNFDSPTIDIAGANTTVSASGTLDLKATNDANIEATNINLKATNDTNIEATNINLNGILKFNPSNNFLDIGPNVYYHGVGNSSFNLPSSGVYLLTIVLENNEDGTTLSDSWFLFTYNSAFYPNTKGIQGCSLNVYSGFANQEYVGVSLAGTTVSVGIITNSGYLYDCYIQRLN